MLRHLQPFSEDCSAVPNFPDGSFAYSEILQENNYYPFGIRMLHLDTNPNGNDDTKDGQYIVSTPDGKTNKSGTPETKILDYGKENLYIFDYGHIFQLFMHFQKSEV